MDMIQNLALIPPLLQASILALLSTSLPLTATLSSVFIAVNPDGTLIDEPIPKQMESATSAHAIAFSSTGNLILVESEGKFNFGQFEAVVNHAKNLCMGDESKKEPSGEDVEMSDKEPSSMQDFIKALVDEKVAKDQSWKEGMR